MGLADKLTALPIKQRKLETILGRSGGQIKKNYQAAASGMTGTRQGDLNPSREAVRQPSLMFRGKDDFEPSLIKSGVLITLGNKL